MPDEGDNIEADDPDEVWREHAEDAETLMHELAYREGWPLV